MAKKILVVDDIFSNRLLLCSALESIGIDSEAVEDGQKAIDILVEDDFGMVLLDIEMPVMNGFETARYIRDEMPDAYKNMPIIALTAHNPDEYSSRMDEAGFDEIMSKPYSVEKLSNIIDKYL